VISVSIASSFFHEAAPKHGTLQVGAVRTDHEGGAALSDYLSDLALECKAGQSGFFHEACGCTAGCGLALGAPMKSAVLS
jgi:hypothetical protein